MRGILLCAAHCKIDLIYGFGSSSSNHKDYTKKVRAE